MEHGLEVQSVQRNLHIDCSETPTHGRKVGVPSSNKTFKQTFNCSAIDQNVMSFLLTQTFTGQAHDFV